MITLYTTSVPAKELCEAYTSIKNGRLLEAIKVTRAAASLGLKQAKDLCDTMRDGRTTETFFISPQTLKEIKSLSLVRLREAITKLEAETAGLMTERQAAAIITYLLDQTGASDPKVQVKQWLVKEESNTTFATPSGAIVTGDVSSTSLPTKTPPPPKRATQESVRWTRPRPTPAAPGTARRRLADELKLAWRRAGEPPLRKLRGELVDKGTDGAVSIASISKAMSGSTGRPPSWTLVKGLLEQFHSSADIDGFWRPLWVQAREEVAPLGLTSTADTTELSTVVPVISLVTTPGQDNNTAAPDQPDDRAPEPGNGAPAGFECEDCGSWVVNADRHYAWHWSMEKQLRRAIIQGVESTGS
ncbi:hypothetical protein AB0K18_33675 [Nonomuraea sp. NPDC049421]|uniref:hypothetical protein n=1 Tax=Nonomuraea sp. NPDC049421 TaxID=3155275 RepID=UPI003439E1FC